MKEEALRALVPRGLALQKFAGNCWVGVVPFRMAGVTHRFVPDIPGMSAFPELNVRTYVELRGKPGVWFFSLDATNPLAVWAARRLFSLPYHRAQMTVTDDGDWVRYASARSGAEFRGLYRPTSPGIVRAPVGSLEHWLTERYCLYAQDGAGVLWRTEIHHHPWPLQPAELVLERNTMLDVHGISVTAGPVLLHFARRLDVVVWNPERAEPTPAAGGL